ncbi:thioredoxin family protein [Neptuniibacter sp. CAU 1671]|uniref:thioredoxin family protein n=1 Tax=Neptuniibacter sp. CAU 1671 TaxID=3032593 RepID=UPI0023DB19C4|nr:thioredoxin family protein [Neptuniibacter sp. CAU 1671]MDF2181083.1 thioredoxin family protein [Neptuniibacter sp. CAU 1671]
MALTPSNMIDLGSPAAPFSLPDPRTGKQVDLNELNPAKGLLVMFICNHCPFVKHIEAGLIQLGEDFRDSGIRIIAISSNDAIAHPADGPGEMALKNYPFPYLYDETQSVAKAYGAACTPDFFLFDAALKLVYRGQFDDSRPSNGLPVTGADLRAAMDLLLTGGAPLAEQKPSIGCNIKWRA